MHRYVPLLAKFAGFKNIAEKVVVHRAREHGKSKFGGIDRGVKGMLDLFSIFITQKYLNAPCTSLAFGEVFLRLLGE